MEVPIATTRSSTRARQWAGLRVVEEGMELALLSAEGGTIEVMRVANEPQAVVRVIKRWRRLHAFDPLTAVFCVEDRPPFAGAVLERMLARGWDILLVPVGSPELSDEEQRLLHAADIARFALRYPARNEPLSATRLHGDKLEGLRRRRHELSLLRSSLNVERGHGRQMGAELQREFERMDRRHAQLIDKLLLRIDALISLQLER